MNLIRYSQKAFLSEPELIELQEENKQWADKRRKEFEQEINEKNEASENMKVLETYLQSQGRIRCGVN